MFSLINIDRSKGASNFLKKCLPRPPSNITRWTFHAPPPFEYLQVVILSPPPFEYLQVVISCPPPLLMRPSSSMNGSVCLSITSFSLCPHHRSIMKFITNDRSEVHAKGQGQRTNVKFSRSSIKFQGHTGCKINDCNPI